MRRKLVGLVAAGGAAASVLAEHNSGYLTALWTGATCVAAGLVAAVAATL
jgi:hypothetical protein